MREPNFFLAKPTKRSRASYSLGLSYDRNYTLSDPIRTRNFGTTWIYLTHIYTSLFGTHLFTDPDRSSLSRHVFNAGFQTDIEVVMFSCMKTTWSVGYARVFAPGRDQEGQFLLSVKRLGM